MRVTPAAWRGQYIGQFAAIGKIQGGKLVVIG